MKNYGFFRSKKYFILSLALAGSILALLSSGYIPPRELPDPPDPPAIDHYIVIDNVCAWPNLSLLPDGTIAAILHNKVHHGRMFGALDCWISDDGQFWEKQDIPVPNEPFAARMNHAAGVAKNGDLIVLCSGWRNNKTPWTLLPVVVARSGDKGIGWTHHKEFPLPDERWGHFVPFGDIITGDDGVLHVSCYIRRRSSNREFLESWFLKSDDDGNTWEPVSVISTNHNETTILHLGGGHWLAGGRRNSPPDGAGPDEPVKVVDLFYSKDNGVSWQGPRPITNNYQHPGHLLLLDDGQVVFTYGNRSNAEGGKGVLAKLSDDQGETWSPPIRIAHLGGDLGYPSSVQRADGKIVTAYYSSDVENHKRYHMGVAIWEAPDTNPRNQPSATIPSKTSASDNIDRDNDCSIGDFEHGGIVFWVDETGKHGLVCAKRDQSPGARWFPDRDGYRLARASDHYLFAGKDNTEKIIAAKEAMETGNEEYAAQVCNDLRIVEDSKTYDDWYLPSIRELNQMYIHRTTINTTAMANDGVGFADVDYWSSTQCTGDQAFTLNFGNGLQRYYNKGFKYRVRAIRAF